MQPWLGAALIGVALTSVGCGSSSAGGGNDSGSKEGGGSDAAKDVGSADTAPPKSACGHPGDKGNSFGVGLYCTSETLADGGAACPATDAGLTLCSSVENTSMPANLQTFFCTLPGCAVGTGSSMCTPAGFCGEDAVCACLTLGCGCIPASCTSLSAKGALPDCVDAGGEGGAGDAGTPVDASTG